VREAAVHSESNRVRPVFSSLVNRSPSAENQSVTARATPTAPPFDSACKELGVQRLSKLEETLDRRIEAPNQEGARPRPRLREKAAAPACFHGMRLRPSCGEGRGSDGPTRCAACAGLHGWFIRFHRQGSKSCLIASHEWTAPTKLFKIDFTHRCTHLMVKVPSVSGQQANFHSPGEGARRIGPAGASWRVSRLRPATLLPNLPRRNERA
jgi:hypothetical protein